MKQSLVFLTIAFVSLSFLFSSCKKDDKYMSDAIITGYDARMSIIFQRENGKPAHQEVDFKPPFSEQLYFVYLEKKQNSREGIDLYKGKSKKIPPQYFTDISALTDAFLIEKDLKNFEKTHHSA